MTGRILYSRAFLTDLNEAIRRHAPVLLEQPVGQVLAEAWNLCLNDSPNDYDPRLRSALGITAQVFDVDVAGMASLADLPYSTEQALDLVYKVGNIHSLAEYLVAQTQLLFSNSNVAAVHFGPIGEETVLYARLWQGKLLLTYSLDYETAGLWLEFDTYTYDNQSEIYFTKQDFADRGLEFYTDFARNSSEVSWIAFPEYRLALGRRNNVPPWIPLPYWK